MGIIEWVAIYFVVGAVVATFVAGFMREESKRYKKAEVLAALCVIAAIWPFMLIGIAFSILYALGRRLG